MSRLQLERKLRCRRRKLLPRQLLLKQLLKKSGWLKRLLSMFRSLLINTTRTRRSLMLKEAKARSRAPPLDYKSAPKRQFHDLGRSITPTSMHVSTQWSSLRGTWTKSGIRSTTPQQNCGHNLSSGTSWR